jgi:hypothetical protein
MAEEKRKRGSGPVKYVNHGLSQTARESLAAHAAKWDQAESVILDHLICTHLRAVKLVPWGKAPREDAPANDSAEASDPVETLPIAPIPHPSAPLEATPTPEQGRGHPRAKRATA